MATIKNLVTQLQRPVFSIEIDASIHEAREKMDAMSVKALAVMENRKPKGLVVYWQVTISRTEKQVSTAEQNWTKGQRKMLPL